MPLQVPEPARVSSAAVDVQAESQDTPSNTDEPADATESFEQGEFQDSESDDDPWQDDEVPTPPPRRPTPGVLKGDALVTAMRQANANEEDIAAALLALSPPPPPDEEDV